MTSEAEFHKKIKALLNKTEQARVMDAFREVAAGYAEAINTQREQARELDLLLNGPGAARRQPDLGALVAQVRELEAALAAVGAGR